MRLSSVSLLLCLTALWPVGASAHLALSSPASRYGPDVLKIGPCGAEGGERSENVTYYEPGETIEVRWDEYVDHPGHYRIAFDADGDDDFVDPSTMVELYSNDAVLVDGITDKGPAEADYVVSVTLPEVTCERCTLQVIQVMYDKPPYTTPGNDIYYQCADLVLRTGGTPPDANTDPDADADADADPDPDPDPDPGTGPGTGTGTGGCSTATGVAGLGPTSMLLIAAGWLLAQRRRYLL